MQNATATVMDTASAVADTAKATVSDKVSSVTGGGDEDVVVDLSPTGADTGAAPMPGAAASSTV